MAQNNTSSNNLWKLISTVFVIVAVIAAYDYRSKYDDFDNRIETGSNPPLIIEHEVVDRADKAKEIVESFIIGPGKELHDFEPFGLIIGPAGTGKTQLIRQICRQNPKGVLYLEIASTDTFVENLAKAIGMRITATFTSVLIGNFFPSYVGYYELPNDYSKGIVVVIENLVERSLAFKEKEGRPVCLFIDGADVLAKYNPTIFQRLIDTAKIYANSGSLRIVFGCSEGSVLPIVHKTSSKSRIKAVEVGDLSDDKAIDYLVKCLMPHELATRVVKFAGGRMIFLRRSILIYRNSKSEIETMNDSAIYEMIMEDLTVYFAEAGMNALVMGGDIAIDIVKHLENFEGGFYPREYLGNLPQHKEVEVEEVIQSLILKNALKYTTKLKIDWHSRLMRNMAIQFFKKLQKL